jgi:protein gp37
MADSAIEWTDKTWNPVRGCARVSPGCEHCYAQLQARRMDHPGGAYEGLTAMGPSGPRWNGQLRAVSQKLNEPLTWRRPSRVFVNSMSDLFHTSVSEPFITAVFDVMGRAPQHQFQVLTKRSERLRELSPRLTWHPNVWMGVSVESEEYLSRVADLRATGASVKFLSLEPLLGPLRGLDVAGIDWIIVGGESGPSARPMDPSWVWEVQRQCRRAAVPFFFKQWGGVRKKRTGRLLGGRTWDEMPVLGQRVRILASA